MEILIVARCSEERARKSRPTIRKTDRQVAESGRFDEQDPALGQKAARTGKKLRGLAQMRCDIPHDDHVELVSEFVLQEIAGEAIKSPLAANIRTSLGDVDSFDVETELLRSREKVAGTAPHIEESPPPLCAWHDLVPNDPGYGGDVGGIAPIAGVIVTENRGFDLCVSLIGPVQPSVTASFAKRDKSGRASRFPSTGGTIHHSRHRRKEAAAQSSECSINDTRSSRSFTAP